MEHLALVVVQRLLRSMTLAQYPARQVYRVKVPHLSNLPRVDHPHHLLSPAKGQHQAPAAAQCKDSCPHHVVLPRVRALLHLVTLVLAVTPPLHKAMDPVQDNVSPRRDNVLECQVLQAVDLQ